jgi:hypothetical protein
MKKFLLVIANYKDQRQEIFDKYYSPRNKEYCQKYGYEYIESKGIEMFRSNPTWWKFTIPLKLIKDGVIKEGDQLLHMDADMIVHNLNYEYPCAKSFTYAIDNGNSHCMGNYSMKINDFTLNMMDDILNDDLWNQCKDTELWTLWREQAAWYTLAGIPRHSWIDFRIMPHHGWHQTEDPFFNARIKYSLKYLYDNVEILGPEWNTTLLVEDKSSIPDGLMTYNISKSRRSNCIIRHFSAGQQWRLDY